LAAAIRGRQLPSPVMLTSPGGAWLTKIAGSMSANGPGGVPVSVAGEPRLTATTPVAMMCMECDPTECHRHRIFIALEEQGLRGFDL
jgi:hypothetical protein